MPAPIPPEELQARLALVRTAAMDLFAQRGFGATSMGAIAEAAGMSRPALYQHFSNREDIFRSALQQILDDANRAALAALDGAGDLTERFDGYLQRCRGDVIGPLLGSPHGDELLEARGAEAQDVADDAHRRRRQRLDAALVEITDGDQQLARRAAELLELGSLGLKHDSPTPRMYRTRLRALAEAAAAMIEARVS
ncbi:MAG: helix-turn-helix domain-containing protein [Actinomycetota bacterium]